MEQDLSPDGVLQQAKKWGVDIVRGTMRWYVRQGLIPAPLVRSLGRGRGAESIFPPETVAELVASNALLGSSFGGKRVSKEELAEVRRIAFSQDVEGLLKAAYPGEEVTLQTFGALRRLADAKKSSKNPGIIDDRTEIPPYDEYGNRLDPWPPPRKTGEEITGVPVPGSLSAGLQRLGKLQALEDKRRETDLAIKHSRERAALADEQIEKYSTHYWRTVAAMVLFDENDERISQDDFDPIKPFWRMLGLVMEWLDIRSRVRAGLPLREVDPLGMS